MKQVLGIVRGFALWLIVHIGYLVLGVALVALGRWTVGERAASESGGAASSATSGESEQVWTCPMHPQIRLPENVPCPLCGMDLVRASSQEDEDPRQLAMSEAARALAQIEVAAVERRDVARSVRMVGKVVLDQAAVRTISAWVPGRLERLFVDSTGVRVGEEEHLVEIYSPELLTAQEELLLARERIEQTAREASRFLGDSNERAYRSARDKLLLWGLSEAQVDAIEERGTPQDRMTIHAPGSGTVIERMVDEGDYVRVGTPLFRIADLSRLWVELDAFEQDLPWLRYGQKVSIEAEAMPGESILGRVTLVEPTLHEHTRTTKLRVHVPNEDGRLKPGMFVRGTARVWLSSEGAVLEEDLSDTWVCPMHPEVSSQEPGECTVCSMPLLPAEELNLSGPAAADAAPPLVIPSSAVLTTGRRAVVYVQVLGAERPTFEGRELRLGPRAGDDYVVLEGLEEGERVVVRGAFRVDSAMQIRAKPSLMSLEAEQPRVGSALSREHRAELLPLVELALELSELLAADEGELVSRLRDRLSGELSSLLAGELLRAGGRAANLERGWLEEAIEKVASAQDIEQWRDAHWPLSRAITELVREVGPVGPSMVEAWCPMAFDFRGAGWLQRPGELANPYFGASMLRCGEIRGRFESEEPPHAESDAASSARAGVEERLELGDPTSPEDAAAGGELDAPPSSEESLDERDGREDAFAPSRADLLPVFERYLEWQQALAADALEDSTEAQMFLVAVVADALSASAPGAPWSAEVELVRGALADELEEDGLQGARLRFSHVSNAMHALEQAAGNPTEHALRWIRCPMAFQGQGANWFQLEGAVSNPYFGARMSRCGLELALRPPVRGPR